MEHLVCYTLHLQNTACVVKREHSMAAYYTRIVRTQPVKPMQ